MTPLSTKMLAQHWTTIQAAWANPTPEAITRCYDSAGVITQCATYMAQCNGLVAWIHALYYAGTLHRLEGAAGKVPGWWKMV